MARKPGPTKAHDPATTPPDAAAARLFGAWHAYLGFKLHCDTRRRGAGEWDAQRLRLAGAAERAIDRAISAIPGIPANWVHAVNSGEQARAVEAGAKPALVRLRALARVGWPTAVAEWQPDLEAVLRAQNRLRTEAWVNAAAPRSTVSVSPARTEVVLWEGAAHTDRNIRLARTRSAYLEAHGDVLAALKALKDSGSPVARSTFYNHLDALDVAIPRWRESVQLSNQTGNLDGMRHVGTRGKSGTKRGSPTVQVSWTVGQSASLTRAAIGRPPRGTDAWNAARSNPPPWP
jgi:hypothetical protein